MALSLRNLLTDHFWVVLLLSAGGIIFFVLFPLFAVLLLAVVVALGLIAHDTKGQ
jgi:fumarate reductase subunit D